MSFTVAAHQAPKVVTESELATIRDGLTQDELAAIQTMKPQTDDELWLWIAIVLNVRIPRVSVCPGHSSPFDALASAYYCREDNLVIEGSRGYAGKCVRSDEIWFSPNGYRRTWGDVENSTFPLYYPDDGGCRATAGVAQDNGIRKVWNISTESGLCIGRTAEHPLLLGIKRQQKRKLATRVDCLGLRRAADVCVGHLLLVPDILPLLAEPDRSFSDHEVSLLGLLLGDGCLTQSSLSFCDGCAATHSEIRGCLEELGGSWTVTGDRVETTRIRFGVGSGSRRKKETKLWHYLVKTGLLGCGSPTKRFPDWAFRLPDTQLGLLLNRLLATDGYIRLRSSAERMYRGVRYAAREDPIVEFSSSSRRLRDDLALAMHRLGISGVSDTGRRAFYRDTQGRRVEGLPSFSWHPYAEYLSTLFDRIGLVLGREEECRAILAHLGTRKMRPWRQRDCPAGYHWERVVSVTTEDAVKTTTVSVPYEEDHLFCGPVVEHNSVLIATLCLTEQITLGATSVVLAGSEKQSKKIHDYVLGSEKVAKGKFWQSPFAPKWMIAGEQLLLESHTINGGSITCVTSSPTQVRSKHPERLRCDECDEIDIDLIDAAIPTTIGSDTVPSHILFSSTYHYPDRAMRELLKRVNTEGYTHRVWCFKEALKPHGWLDPEEVEKKKRGTPKHVWKVEIELQRPNPKGRIFTTDDIDRLFERGMGYYNSEADEVEFYQPIPPEDCRDNHCFTGADWAKLLHKTAIFTMTEYSVDEPATIACYRRFNKLPWPVTVGFFNDQVEAYGGPSAHDVTGMGDVINDYLTVDSEPFDFRKMRERTDAIDRFIDAVKEGPGYIFPLITAVYEEFEGLTQQMVYGKLHLPDTFVAAVLAHYARSFSQGMNIERPGGWG